MICMRSSMASINTMSIDDMKIAALKDDNSMSTFGSNYDAKSAASVDCLSTFEQWNISRRPFYQISDDLTQKLTCNICMEEVFSRFTSMGKLSGCGHDFCYRCIWKWENKTIIHGKAFHCPLCRKKHIPMDELQKGGSYTYTEENPPLSRRCIS